MGTAGEVVEARDRVLPIIGAAHFCRVDHHPDRALVVLGEALALRNQLRNELGFRLLVGPGGFEFVVRVDDDVPDAVADDRCAGTLQQPVDRRRVLHRPKHVDALVQPSQRGRNVVLRHAVVRPVEERIAGPYLAQVGDVVGFASLRREHRPLLVAETGGLHRDLVDHAGLAVVRNAGHGDELTRNVLERLVEFGKASRQRLRTFPVVEVHHVEREILDIVQAINWPRLGMGDTLAQNIGAMLDQTFVGVLALNIVLQWHPDSEAAIPSDALGDLLRELFAGRIHVGGDQDAPDLHHGVPVSAERFVSLVAGLRTGGGAVRQRDHMHEAGLRERHHVDLAFADDQVFTLGDAVGVEEHRLRVLLLPKLLAGGAILDVAKFAVPLVGERNAVLLLLRLRKPLPGFVDPELLDSRRRYAALAEPTDERVRPLRRGYALRLAIGSTLARWPIALAASRASPAAMVAVPDRSTIGLDGHRQTGIGFLAPAARTIRANGFVVARFVVPQANAVFGESCSRVLH